MQARRLLQLRGLSCSYLVAAQTALCTISSIRCRRVGDFPRRQDIRYVQACHADAVVGHPVIHVEAVRTAEIVPPVNAGGKHHVGDGPVTFLR